MISTQLPPVNISLIETAALTYLPNIVAALGIVLAGYILYRVIRTPFSNVLKRSHVDDALVRILANIVKFVIFIFAIVMAAGQLGINVTAALAGIGVAGIALGFAAQDSLSNIISGFIIFIDKPFKVGDFISYADHYGKVELITLRSTRIRKPNNTYVVIPNQKIVSDVVTDHSTNGKTRIQTSIGIDYEVPLAQVRDVLVAAVRAMDDILDDPAPDVVVDSFADSSVNILVRAWIEDAANEHRMRYVLNEKVKESLQAAGIDMPSPYMEIVQAKR